MKVILISFKKTGAYCALKISGHGFVGKSEILPNKIRLTEF